MHYRKKQKEFPDFDSYIVVLLLVQDIYEYIIIYIYILKDRESEWEDVVEY